MAARSAEVDAIIADVPGWRATTIAGLRKLIHAADPHLSEAAKWKKPSNPLGVAVFEREGIVCVVIPLKERVRLMFPQGSRLPDPKKLFNAQLNGTSRAIDFHEGEELDAAPIKKLVIAALARQARAKAPAKKAARKT